MVEVLEKKLPVTRRAFGNSPLYPDPRNCSVFSSLINGKSRPVSLSDSPKLKSANHPDPEKDMRNNHFSVFSIMLFLNGFIQWPIDLIILKCGSEETKMYRFCEDWLEL